MKNIISWFFIAALVVVGCAAESEDSDSLDYELEITETLTWSAQGITQINAATPPLLNLILRMPTLSK